MVDKQKQQIKPDVKYILVACCTYKRADLMWVLLRKYYEGYMGAILRFKYNKKGIIKQITYILESLITVATNIIIASLSIIAGVACFVNLIFLRAKNFWKLAGAISLKSIYYYKPQEEDNG